MNLGNDNQNQYWQIGNANTIITIETFNHMPEYSHPVAILCLGYGDKFYDKPMLEQQQWQNRKDLNTLLFENTWDTPCR
jgi:5,6-dimethylbenzimidazole synthase